MEWIIDVDIRSRAWICRFDFLVALPVIAAAERWLDCLIHDDLVLDVILLLLVIIFTRAWIHRECLPCVWCHTLVLPEFTSLRLEEERLWLLAYELAIGVHSLVLVGLLLYGDHCLVGSWPWCLGLVLCILAVWDFRLEDGVFTGRIELFLTQLGVVIDSRSWVFVPSLIVVGLLVIFK